MSCSAARRRRIRRSCAGPTCWRAWCSTGSATRACPTCSPACSSARPRRRRASTRRATTSCYELEIALSLTPPPGCGDIPPWLDRDRLFRNLLVDVTGNTHRAEICIDKLYSPDSATGRLGLVEFRAFEMPPGRAHVAGAATAAARAGRLVLARAAATASRCAGARSCTTASCCRISSGRISSTCSTISSAPATPSIPTGSRRARIPLPRLRPSSSTAACGLELRTALEPWHVLGEEARSAARCAMSIPPSSVCRSRPGVSTPGAACHRLQRPQAADDLHRRQRRGGGERALQGVAAAIPAMHPTIAPHAPLTFDVLDAWSGRSLGGCVYHVAHPGGRNYETFAGQRLRGRGAPARPLPGPRPHPRPDVGAAGRSHRRLPDHAGFAQAHRGLRHPGANSSIAASRRTSAVDVVIASEAKQSTNGLTRRPCIHSRRRRNRGNCWSSSRGGLLRSQ